LGKVTGGGGLPAPSSTRTQWEPCQSMRRPSALTRPRCRPQSSALTVTSSRKRPDDRSSGVRWMMKVSLPPSCWMEQSATLLPSRNACQRPDRSSRVVGGGGGGLPVDPEELVSMTTSDTWLHCLKPAEPSIMQGGESLTSTSYLRASRR